LCLHAAHLHFKDRVEWSVDWKLKTAAFAAVFSCLKCHPHATKRPAPKKGPATSDNAPSALPEQSLSDQILAETKTAEIAHSV